MFFHQNPRNNFIFGEIISIVSKSFSWIMLLVPGCAQWFHNGNYDKKNNCINSVFVIVLEKTVHTMTWLWRHHVQIWISCLTIYFIGPKPGLNVPTPLWTNPHEILLFHVIAGVNLQWPLFFPLIFRKHFIRTIFSYVISKFYSSITISCFCSV